MQRTGKLALNQIISRINKYHDEFLQLDHNAQGYRLMTHQGSRDLSPRLKPTMMRLWLEAFEIGLDYANLSRLPGESPYVMEKDDPLVQKSLK